MRVLVVGGSGYVGRLVLPFLVDSFTLRVFDRLPPSIPSVDYVQGDVTNPEALASAAEGMDALLYLAMGRLDGMEGIDTTDSPVPAYDVNVKGLHLALEAAVAAGISRVVQISTVSVYGRGQFGEMGPVREDQTPEPWSVYGLTKFLAEEVCHFFSYVHGLSVFSLRIFRPVSEEEWRSGHVGVGPTGVDAYLRASDLARAVATCLECEHSGFETLNLTGDHNGRTYPFDKAKRLIGWQPTERQQRDK